MAEQLICNQQVDGSTPFTSSSLYGGIPERPKGADCKSVVTDFAGPNPASPTITKNRPLWSVFCYGMGGSTFGLGICRANAAGSHTPTEVRRARSSGEGSGYLRHRRIPSFFILYLSTLVVGFLLCREADGNSERCAAYRRHRA